VILLLLLLVVVLLLLLLLLLLLRRRRLLLRLRLHSLAPLGCVRPVSPMFSPLVVPCVCVFVCLCVAQAVIAEKADVLGLSGLITPSLDEMVFVAAQMKKAGMSVPLLIGGATTSRMHTAVKIAPQYFTTEHPVIHVLDASRSVTVVASLLEKNREKRGEYVGEVAELYDEMREVCVCVCVFVCVCACLYVCLRVRVGACVRARVVCA
jgi:hypothetical protein